MNSKKSAPASPARQLREMGDGNGPNVSEPLSAEEKGYTAQFLTTEHFTLQTARSATIADSSSRAGLFMTTVSTSLIALAFVGQMSQAGTAFNAFALVLLPTLFFLGLVTFQRVLQSAIADAVFARGINRIRHFYTEIAPLTGKYLILSANDDSGSTLRGVRAYRWQWFLTTAGTIMVINSVLLGGLVALAARAFFDPPLLCLVLGGLITFGVSLTLHYVYQDRKWSGAMKRMPVAFPSDPDELPARDKAAGAQR